MRGVVPRRKVTAMKQWFYTVNGELFGPMNEATLAQQCQEADNTERLLIWSDGMDDWAPAWMFLKLDDILHQESSPPVFSAFPETGGAWELEATGALPIAPLWKRSVAAVLDSILAVAVSFIAYFPIGVFLSIAGAPVEASMVVFVIAILVTPMLYFAGFECSDLHVILGKRFVSIIVTDDNGRRLTFSRSAKRYGWKFVSTLLLGAGFLAAILSDQRRTLHDKMAGTLVLDEKQSPRKPAPAIVT